MKPTPILIAALQINVGWPGQVWVSSQDHVMADTGIEPDIQDIGFLAEIGGAASTVRSFGQQFRGAASVPGVSALNFEYICYVIDDLLVQ